MSRHFEMPGNLQNFHPDDLNPSSLEEILQRCCVTLSLEKMSGYNVEKILDLSGLQRDYIFLTCEKTEYDLYLITCMEHFYVPERYIFLDFSDPWQIDKYDTTATEMITETKIETAYERFYKPHSFLP